MTALLECEGHEYVWDIFSLFGILFAHVWHKEIAFICWSKNQEDNTIRVLSPGRCFALSLARVENTQIETGLTNSRIGVCCILHFTCLFEKKNATTSTGNIADRSYRGSGFGCYFLRA